MSVKEKQPKRVERPLITKAGVMVLVMVMIVCLARYMVRNWSLPETTLQLAVYTTQQSVRYCSAELATPAQTILDSTFHVRCIGVECSDKVSWFTLCGCTSLCRWTGAVLSDTAAGTQRVLTHNRLLSRQSVVRLQTGLSGC